ncbi:MAG TPA: hypothetical protein VN887_17900 [Candidatus Angelobacter sp.]|nr:hypothetical protein [Candidatus Angelobacter sp.]
MLPVLCACKRIVFLWLFAGTTTAILAQNAYAPQGGEYPIAGSLPGDQVFPQIALGTNGGYLVWQDNVTDGDGLGISARKINSSLSGSLGVFRVNQLGAGDQENARVALLKDGGAVFVWQGGTPGFQHIYARFLKSDGTFAAGDLLVNTYTNNHQIDPTVAVLANGNVVVSWSSYGQDGSMYGVYAQIFSPTGDRIGAEFQVNQTTFLSQRTPVVAGLVDGGFVAAWISEKSLGVDTNGAPRYTAIACARLFDSSANPKGDEFQINAGGDISANPSVAASANGGFAVAWSRKDGAGTITSIIVGDSWDVYVRCFDAAGNAASADSRINTYTYGDQFAPKIASLGSDFLAVWTSIAQDGSREGVYGQFLSANGQPLGDEFRANTTTTSQQFQPSLASDGAGRFLVVWSSFVGGGSSFDLFAQRYAATPSLPAPAAPFVYAPFILDGNGTYQPQLQASWPLVEGLPVANYEVYVDGATSPATTTTGNIFTLTGIVPSSTHSLRLDYVTTDGRRSPLSAAVSGTTWSGANYGGIPFEWMTAWFGPNVLDWPKPTDDGDGDGATTLQEFLAGTAPNDPNSVMRVQLVATAQGARVSWNTQPGFVYQVQVSQNLSSWVNFGSERFAAGTNDSIPANGSGSAVYYRVLRLR